MDLTVVGGGLTGLTAAIEAAERGWRVTVHEARSTFGGRAATLEGPYRANRGPHALYADGPLSAWLEQRGLNPPTVTPSGETLFSVEGSVQPLPAAVGQAIAALPATAPVDESFPAVMRTPTLAAATDHSAAPGLLAEVAHNAVQIALTTLGDTAPAPERPAPQSGPATA